MPYESVALNQPFVDRVKNGSFQLMMEIHRRLALVMFGVAVDELLIVHAIHVGEFEIGNEPGPTMPA